MGIEFDFERALASQPVQRTSQKEILESKTNSGYSYSFSNSLSFTSNKTYNYNGGKKEIHYGNSPLDWILRGL